MTVDAKMQAFSGFMALVTGALGFAAPWPEVVSGFLFAVAGGYAGMFVSPPQHRMSVWATLGVALLIGAFAGMLHPHFAAMWAVLSWIAEVPLQLVMGIAGLTSRWIAKRLVSGKLPVFERGSDHADS
ncbi:hypothetical protein [Erythrobacter sp. EC-HK427]|uniref:hypothetical protein n=1 Tax=Erythrobacter sp. EC-HK427 TaxID=2038396 RepID=UPI001259E623|nr:hypothetical protein [Erythrobacter sp. EC-HK427]VVT07373.1 conserved membrane hypothetical protein [Erythrobacter sp. EC-HK427]